MATVPWIEFGDPVRVYTAAPAFSTFILDATTDALEFICQMPEAATITHVLVRYGVRAGTPPTYRASLQGVDATGIPDGTVKGGGSPASVTFTPPADTTWDGTMRVLTLANSYTAARGEFLALVIDYSSGTIAAGNSSTFTAYASQVRTLRQGFPYVIQNNATVRTRQAASAMPVFGLRTASTTYGYPLASTTAPSVNSNSTPDEIAIKFTLPTSMGDTVQCVGARVWAGLAAGKSLLMTLYDTDGTSSIQTLTIDSDVQSAAGSNERLFEWFFDETTLSTLTIGSAYRLSFSPQETTTAFLYRTVSVAAVGDWDAFPGGQQCLFSTRTDTGAWTDTDTDRLLAELLFRDWTEPTAGGGQNRAILPSGVSALG